MAVTASATSNVAAVALLDEPVRRRLYDWVVAQHRPVGREEAARNVGTSRALAAFHLDRLTEAGLLEASYKRLTGRTGPGAGRPARVYQRSEVPVEVSLPPRRYELVADLFAAALQQMGDGSPPAALARVAHAAGERVGRQATEAGGLLSVLEEAGYEPSADVDGTVRLRNCPFDALVDDHRALVCGTNLCFAQGILDGLPERQGAEFEPHADSRLGFCCVVFAAPGN